MKAQTLAILAGIAWGVWPLLASRGGLTGNTQSLVLIAIALMATLPFAIKGGSFGSVTATGMIFLTIAGILMASGMLFFNNMLVKANGKQVASLFIITLVAQIAVPTLYQILSGNATGKHIIGIGAAIVAAILLG